MDRGRPPRNSPTEVPLKAPPSLASLTSHSETRPAGFRKHPIVSFETELKFRIPADLLESLRKAVATKSATTSLLEAYYYDTSEAALANARMALRLRCETVEGVSHWEQTLKGEGPSALQRLEHNVAFASQNRPALDVRRHDSSPAGKALGRLLKTAGAPDLEELYHTSIRRTRRTLSRGGARIEIALDEGCIQARGLQIPVCEVEFELLRGDLPAFMDFVQTWVDRFRLQLDTRSKSVRGHWLAHSQTIVPPTKSQPLDLRSAATPEEALRAMLNNTLSQVLANASQLSDVHTGTEHLHQLRVGLRRLRTVLRVYGHLAPLAGHDQVAALASLFQKLGATRDFDAMAESLWPALHAAGAPLVEPPESAKLDSSPEPAALLRSEQVQTLWLGLISSFNLVDPKVTPLSRSTEALRAALVAPLKHLHKQVKRDSVHFSTLDDPSRHALRRRIKRLRYAAELCGSLWSPKAVSKYLRRLQKAQTPLGEFNDAVVAEGVYRNLAGEDPRAWFPVGWLVARRAALLKTCARSLKKAATEAVFWE